MCRFSGPVKHVGALRVGKIDIDEAPEIANQNGIRGAPTVVLFRNGTEAARQVGVTTKERLLKLRRA